MYSTAVLPSSYHSTEVFPTSSPSLEIKLLKLDLASQRIYVPNQSTSESFMGTRFGENYTSLDLNGLKTAGVKADHAIISSEIMTGTSPHHIKDLVSSAKLSEPTPTSRLDMTPLYKTAGGSNLGTPRDYNFSNLSFVGAGAGSKDELLLKNYNLHSSQDFLGETAAKTGLDIAQIVKENLPSSGQNLRNSALGIDFPKTPVSSSNIAEEVKRMLEKDTSPVLAKQPTEFASNFDSFMPISQIVKENLPSTENLKKSSTPGGYLEEIKVDSTGSSSNIAQEVKKMLEKDKLAEVQSAKLSTESDFIAQIVKENLKRSMTAGYLDSVDLKEKIPSNKSAEDIYVAQIVKENLPSGGSYLEAPKTDFIANTESSSNIAEEVKKMLEKDKLVEVQSAKLTTDSDLIAQIVRENFKRSMTAGYLDSVDLKEKIPSNKSAEDIHDVKKFLEKEEIAQIVKENLPSGGSYLETQKTGSSSNIAEEVKKMLEKDKQADAQKLKLSTDFVNNLSISQIVKENLPPGGSYLEAQKAPSIVNTGSSSNIAEEVKKMLEQDKKEKKKPSEVEPTKSDLIAQIVKENFKRSLTAGYLEIQNDSVDLNEKIASNKSAEDIYDVKRDIAQIVKENLPSGGSYLETQKTDYIVNTGASSSNIAEEVKKILEQEKKNPLEVEPIKSDLIVKENFKRSQTAGYLDSVDLKEKIVSNKSPEDHHSLTNDFVIAQIVKENLKNNTIPSIKSTEDVLEIQKILEEPLRKISDDNSLLIAQIVKENLKTSSKGGSYLDVDLREKTSSSKSSEVMIDVQKILEEPLHLDSIAKIVKENLPSISVSHNEKKLEKEELLKSDDEIHELMIAQIVKENLPVSATSEILEETPEPENHQEKFDAVDIQNILNLDIKDLPKYLNTKSTGVTPRASHDLEIVPDVVNKEILPQRNNSAGLDIQDILNEFNPKNPVIKEESTHEDNEPNNNIEGLLGNLKSTENVKASISLNFEFEYNLEKQNEISISEFIDNLQADDEHPSYNELLLLVQNYASARVFRGSEQTLFLALSFAFFEKLIFKDQNLLVRMTLDYPSIENIYEYADHNSSYEQFLKRLKAYLQLDNETRDAVSFFESITNSTKDYQNSLLLFKDILLQVFASSEDYFAFISNCMTQQSFKWMSSPSLEDSQTLFNLLTKILKTSIRLITFTTESIQENIFISPSESFITIFYDQRSAASYILTKKEEEDQEIPPVSEERRGIMQDNVSDRDTQVEVSELSMGDYQAQEFEDEEQVLQNRPIQLEPLDIPKVREVPKVVVEETPIETEFAPTIIENDPQIESNHDESIEEQLSNQEELIAIETHSDPMIVQEEEEEEIVQNEEIVQPIHIKIQEIDLFQKSDSDGEVKDDVVAKSEKVMGEINAILKSLSLNNSPVRFAPIESFSKEVDCSPSHALRAIPNYIKKPLLQTTEEVQAQDKEFMEISNQYLNLLIAKSETPKANKPEALINLYKKILAKKQEKSQESQGSQEELQE